MSYKLPRRPITLADGNRMSLQASETHYCTPRNDDGPYTAIEVGFVTTASGERAVMPEEWHAYADDCESPAQSDVYGYVPIAIVERYIAAHGGRVNFS